MATFVEPYTPPELTPMELFYEVAKLAAPEGQDLLLWHVDEETGEIRVYANCSDVFQWGAADAEEITSENLLDLQQAIVDLRAVGGDPADGFDLFAARIRGMRPQAACYKHYRVVRRSRDEDGNVTIVDDEDTTAEVFHLFDSAGPDRLFHSETQHDIEYTDKDGK